MAVTYSSAVTDADFAREVEQHEGLTMVDFWAGWCGPCNMVAPIVEEIAEEYDGNAVFLDSLDGDAERLERINQLLKDRPEGTAGSHGMKPVELLMLRPSRDLGALSRGYEDRLPGTLRWAVNSMGGKRQGSSDFVSYLLFDPVYTDQLVDLGYNDVCARWEKIENFLGDGARRQEW